MEIGCRQIASYALEYALDPQVRQTVTAGRLLQRNFLQHLAARWQALCGHEADRNGGGWAKELRARYALILDTSRWDPRG